MRRTAPAILKHDPDKWKPVFQTDRVPGGPGCDLEDCEITQQRDYADDDHHDADDLLGTAVDRQQVDEIKHQNDDDERDQNADEDGHENASRSNARNNAHSWRSVPSTGQAAPRRVLVYRRGATEPAMSEQPSLIMIQFLAWVADRPRSRDQAMEAWHSCPHISAWEDAIVDGLVRIENDGGRTVALTD